MATVKVRRANVILQIKADQVQRFLDQGYSVIGKHGEILKEAVPVNAGELRAANMKYRQKIADLEAEIEELKAEIKKLKETAVAPKAKQTRARSTKKEVAE